ncbi:MAG TPA: glycosyltransferase [Segeticoccus sp.]|uniref:glycosyltransferase n=1 Tax=Segeticoccus sp. TaxID=2706531 RepID=UPI002D7EF19B|nr:glycosyltransferase [Segeticoccus sp.]HET8599494.1 glycosyltransferase [Segeticoccus sp.]
MKVLTVIDSLGFGGAERLLPTLAAAGPAAGLELVVASLEPQTAERSVMVPRLQAAGVAPRYLDVSRLAERGAVGRVADAIRRSGCDVVHAHLGTSSTLVPRAARRTGVPCFCTLHTLPEQFGGRSLLRERLCVESAGRSNGLLFVSEAARAAYAHRYRARPSWRVVHNGIDLKTWAPGAGGFPEDLGLPWGVPVASIVAALRAPKGHALAIAAWRSVLRRVPDAHLLIVGDGPEEPMLRRLAERTGVARHVVFAGRRDSESETADIVRASDVVLLPSYTEALPTTLIEAAACARPVVATDVGGTGEVVDHRRTGLLVPRGQIAALADAVSDLLVDEDRRRRMGLAARRHAELHFDMHDWAATLHDLYADALEALAAPAVAGGLG